MMKLPKTELPLVAMVTALGREMMQDAEETDANTDPLAFYGEAFMENTSEAGYSEARPTGRRSCRALARIIRVNSNDLKAVKKSLGFRRGEYHDFALSQTILEALNKWAEVAPALSLIAAPAGIKAKGPFFPTRDELRLNTKSNWAFYCVLVGKRTDEVEQASIKLAGLLKVNQRDLNTIARKLIATGASESELPAMLAKVVLETVRTSPRFVAVLNWTQPQDDAAK
jgi:hypothetical protein